MNRTLLNIMKSSFFFSLVFLPSLTSAANRDDLPKDRPAADSTNQGKITIRQDWTNPPSQPSNMQKPSDREGSSQYSWGDKDRRDDPQQWRGSSSTYTREWRDTNPQYNWGDRDGRDEPTRWSGSASTYTWRDNPQYNRVDRDGRDDPNRWRGSTSTYTREWRDTNPQYNLRDRSNDPNQGGPNLQVYTRWDNNQNYPSNPHQRNYYTYTQRQNWFERGSDLNGNGVIDPWEKKYARGSTYSSYPGHTYYSSGADVDGDGVVEPWERNSYSSGMYTYHPRQSYYSSSYGYPSYGSSYGYPSYYSNYSYDYPSSGFYDSSSNYPYSQYYNDWDGGGSYYHYR